MNTSILYLTNRFILLIIISGIISCDSATVVEPIEPESKVAFTQSHYYILPGSTIIIDLKSLVEESFSNATLSVLENPQRGTVSYADTFLLKYVAARDFYGGQDHFFLSAKSDGKTLAHCKVTINMKGSKEEFPCSLVAIEDKIKIEPGLSVSIPVIENDRVCGSETSGIHISIHAQPKMGQVMVEGESILYTAGTEFQGRDQFIYKLASSSDEDATFAIISITRGRLRSISTPSNFITEMVFVDENTGYISGSSIYKTSDGGEHWTEMVDPENISYGYFTYINFLRANEGFAMYSVPCFWDSVCGCGLATTKDGESWKVGSILFPESFVPSSVFFTSSTTGFIAGNLFQEQANHSQIFKTEDGGETWKKVFATQYQAHNSEFQSGDGLTIKFADFNLGYAYQKGKIFFTQDAGESWQIFASDDYIYSVALNPNDILFAGFTITGSYTSPTSIVKFHGASNVKEVANIPHKIWQLEFSPNGNVGFALGIKGNQLESPSRTLSINTSIDKGETWTEEYVEDIDFLSPYEYPAAMAVPSENVIYFLYANTIVKYSNK